MVLPLALALRGPLGRVDGTTTHDLNSGAAGATGGGGLATPDPFDGPTAKGRGAISSIRPLERRGSADHHHRIFAEASDRSEGRAFVLSNDLTCADALETAVQPRSDVCVPLFLAGCPTATAGPPPVARPCEVAGNLVESGSELGLQARHRPP